jgi:hypothetical protein
MAYMRNIQASLGTLARGDMLEFGVNGTLQPADITGVNPGQFGHGAGYVIVPALGPHIALALKTFVFFYDAQGAAYGGGGNVSVNYGGGGPALTGIFSAANFAASTLDKDGIYYPLATAGVNLVENVSINLVSTAAFTQPGTAAGVIRYACVYLAIRTGFLP